MFVHYPHDLCSIHSRSSAERDDRIRFECTHLICTKSCALQSRIRSYFVETCMLDSHFIQFCFDRSYISILVQERVCYDKCSFLMHDRSKFIQCNRHTAFLKVYFFWCSEPKHILSPLGNSLDVDQMFYPNIFRYRVSTPGTASKCQRRSKFEVVQITDTPLG